MESILEIADKISKERGYKSIDQVIANSTGHVLFDVMVLTSKEYGKQVAIEQREKCSKEISIHLLESEHYRAKILNTKLVVD